MKQRIIIVINLLRKAAPTEEIVTVQGVRFSLVEHHIGWDFETAMVLAKKFDGFADAIVIAGHADRVRAGDLVVQHSFSRELISAVQKSSVYSGIDLRDIFTGWTVKKVLKEEPQFFNAKTVLFHMAAVSNLFQFAESSGANVEAADSLMATGIPMKVRSTGQLKLLLRGLRNISPVLKKTGLEVIKPRTVNTNYTLESRLRSWILDADIFVTYGSLMTQIGSFDVLKGKTVIVDYLTQDLHRKLKTAGVSRILEILPHIPGLEEIRGKNFGILEAVIDQLRSVEEDHLTLQDYVLNLISENNVRPSRVEVLKPAFERCAFIVHPLQRRDLFRAPQLRWIEKAPEFMQDMAERGVAHMAPFYHGRISGIRSQANGREILCDIYAIPATPKQILELDEEYVYKRLVDTTKLAHKRGCSMIGLGAYTKVVGDSGITVASRSPIPVTNGNSYSAASTLWAARIMMERIGLVETASSGGARRRATAAVIGATGSIGRVSAKLLSLVVDELILVATRADKLLELREEINASAPEVRVKVVTKVGEELGRCDLIVTATSNRSGKILDIEQVKPGAVICDCSRPLDIGADDARKRPDVMVIESGEIDLPGRLEFTCDIGLPYPSVYACLAETAMLTLEGKLESFSLGRNLSMSKVREIYRIGVKHGAKLSAIRGPLGVITDEQIQECKRLALVRLAGWKASAGAMTTRMELPT